MLRKCSICGEIGHMKNNKRFHYDINLLVPVLKNIKNSLVVEDEKIMPLLKKSKMIYPHLTNIEKTEVQAH